MELSALQTSILEAPSNRSVVISSAASGKTRLMTEKVRQLLRAGVNPKGIAVITFTNMAAVELRQRLGADYKDGLFVGTIHALANYFLLSSGINTGNILNNEDFDKLFDLVSKNPQCIRHIEWILLDEAQDSDELQFNFLFKKINPDYFFICADPKQSIYQWKGSNPQLVTDLANKSGVKTFSLNENYRNGEYILNYARRLIYPTGLEDDSVAMRDTKGYVLETQFSTDAIISQINNRPNYKEWAILCRTNNEINDIIRGLVKNKIPYDTFKQGDLSKDELSEKMEQNTVKVLTVHSAKGLEWDNVAVIGMKYHNSEERNICYVAATRARNFLIWTRRPVKSYKKYNDFSF